MSARMKKTVLVEVVRIQQHAVFGKFLKRRKKLMAHDEEGRCKVGDRVEIIESRPLSRLKRWRVTRVLKQADATVAAAEAAAGGTP